MAPPAGTLRVGRYFLALIAIFVVLYALVFWPGKRHVPKLGLDLEGGTQVVLQAKTPNGKTPSKSSMEEARNIMEQRVNSYGVAEATVVVQGADEIVISIPGRNASDRLAQIGSAAQLNFRGLVMPVVQPVAAAAAAQSSAAAASSKAAAASASGSAAASSGSAAASSGASAAPATSGASATKASSSVAAQADHVAPLADHVQPIAAAPSSASAAATSAAPATATAPASAGASSAAATGAASATPSLSADATKLLSGTSVVQDPLAVLAGQFAIPTSDTEFAKLTTDQQSLLQAAVQHFDCQSSPPDTKAQTYLLACDSKTNPQAIYLLGPVIVPGTEIDDASAVTDSTTGNWSISLALKSSGQSAWAKYTTAHNTGGSSSSASVTSCSSTTVPCADFVGFTLDGEVISSPYNEAAINGGNTQISGQFTQSSANDLANQLKYGALPLSFNQQTAANVSATLGSGQLKAGLLAGGIGLVLVVIYSLLYYRALGLVTIASLLVSGGLTYASIVFLGRQIDFTLTLSGIAGFIVAVGITADSFVVYFERIKDEVHEGRSMRVATPRAWVRARRTILSADTVSFLAAAVLYYFAAGDVRGFAFTLGLSTILDLVVVFLFTHPLVSLLSRSRAFGSARFTGLDSARDGGVVSDDSTAAVKRPAKRAATPSERVPVGSIRLDKPSAAKANSIVAVADDEAELDDVVEIDAAETDGDEAPAPKVDTTKRAAAPQAGSAAERAAARRAKLREQQSGAGSDSKDQS